MFDLFILDVVVNIWTQKLKQEDHGFKANLEVQIKILSENDTKL